MLRMNLAIALIDDHLGLLVTLLIVAEVVLLALVLVLMRQWALLRKSIFILKKGTDGQNMVEQVAEHIEEVRDNSDRVDDLSRKYDYVLDVLAGTVQRVAVVRFDAFEDMGGKLSYAVAMLDDERNGVIYTSIYGRNENRTYAKAVAGGRSAHTLSKEEDEALRRALRMKPEIVRPRPSEGRRVFDVTVEEDLEEYASQREEDGTWTI
jgi:hypothetical protein